MAVINYSRKLNGARCCSSAENVIPFVLTPEQHRVVSLHCFQRASIMQFKHIRNYPALMQSTTYKPSAIYSTQSDNLL